jgi:hypothetical protein
MRHKQWEEIVQFLHRIAETLGNSIHDVRNGKNWDAGQAVCAEAYGEEWMKHPKFIEWNNKDDSEPPEPHYYACAKIMANDGYVPWWVEKGHE